MTIEKRERRHAATLLQLCKLLRCELALAGGSFVKNGAISDEILHEMVDVDYLARKIIEHVELDSKVQFTQREVRLLLEGGA